MKSAFYLSLEKERKIEGVLLAADEFSNLSFMDGNDISLMRRMGVIVLGVVEERGTRLDAGRVRAEGIEKGLDIHL